MTSNILLVITGSIAAYKSPEIIRGLQKHGHFVKAIMTKSATQFITPLTIQTLTSQDEPPFTPDDDSSYLMRHIVLSKWAEKILIAPATASTISKIATGTACCDISSTILASDSLLYIAPAMNKNMWQNSALQSNISIIQKRGVKIIQPVIGSQACGDYGSGCMASSCEIISFINSHKHNSFFHGKKVLVTTGPTVEDIDPVRFLTNYSSGEMGNCMARAAFNAGAFVDVIQGQCNISHFPGIKYTRVKTCLEMYNQVLEKIDSIDIFIAAAAVTDYRPKMRLDYKFKKTDEEISLELVKNPDILMSVCKRGGDLFTIGFAAETGLNDNDLYKKIDRKNCDILVANDISLPDSGFNSDYNEVKIITKGSKSQIMIQRDTKQNIATKIVDSISKISLQEFA